MTHRRHTLVRLLAIASVAAVVGGATSLATAASQRRDPAEEPRPSIGGWPADTNGDGQVDDSGAERIPELIRAVGDHGVEGYVRFEDLQGPQPSNPEEAVALANKDVVILLYAEDGKTVLDTYTLHADAVATP